MIPPVVFRFSPDIVLAVQSAKHDEAIDAFLLQLQRRGAGALLTNYWPTPLPRPPAHFLLLLTGHLGGLHPLARRPGTVTVLITGGSGAFCPGGGSLLAGPSRSRLEIISSDNQATTKILLFLSLLKKDDVTELI